MTDRRRVTGLLILLFAITYIDRVCISVAGPRMQEDLGIDPVRWGWVTAMFTLSYCLFEIPTGALGDRIGPRRVLTRIVLWWSAFTSLTGAVSNYYLLLFTRFCFGAGEAGAFPNASHRRLALVSGVAAREHGGRDADGQPDRRRHRAAAGRADPDALRMARRRSLSSARRAWSGRRCGTRGFAIRPPRSRRPREPRERRCSRRAASPRTSRSERAGARRHFPWRLAFRSETVLAVLVMAFCYIYVYTFFQTWFHTFLIKGRGFTEGEPAAVGAAVRGGRVHEPRGRRRERRAGSPFRREVGPPDHRHHRPRRGVRLHHCRDADEASAADGDSAVAGLRRDHVSAVRRLRRLPRHRRHARRLDRRLDEHLGAGRRLRLLARLRLHRRAASTATTPRSSRWPPYCSSARCAGSGSIRQKP